jgi:predicted O-methyltransferase YrrM
VKISAKLKSWLGLQAESAPEYASPAPEYDVGNTFPNGHYYSPIPERKDVLEHIANKPAASASLPSVDLNVATQLEMLAQFKPFYADLPFTHRKNDDCRFWYVQDWFGQADSIYLYSMLRHFKPQRIIEVGSGFSSAVMFDTRERFLDPATQITLVEPYTERLRELLRPGDLENCTLLEDRVQNVPLSVFSSLGKNDLLFIDSSHVLKCASDLQHLMFQVLPGLKPGVIVHFHDIFYPFEYPKDWLEEGRYWNECYLLHAFLSNNNEWEILLFGNYVSQFHRDVIEANVPLALENTGGSLYLRRKG